MDEKKIVKNGDFVLFGDYFGVIEEFFFGDGVREENGEFYVIRVGKVRIDFDKMEISVEFVIDVLLFFRVGDVVIGRVVEVKF